MKSRMRVGMCDRVGRMTGCLADVGHNGSNHVESRSHPSMGLAIEAATPLKVKIALLAGPRSVLKFAFV